MSVDNLSFFKSMKWVVRLLITLIALDLFLSFLAGSLSDIFPNHELAVISTGLLLLLGFLRFSYFSYEDEYEIIHIDTRSLVFGFLESPKHKHYEFAKNILAGYNIEKGALKHRLTITVNSSTGDKKLRHFDLYYLSEPKRQYVINSLEKVLEHNNK
jgi:general stress protein CsbA